MRLILVLLLCASVFVGCGKNETTTSNPTNVTPDRREIGRKLILKSLADLEQKNLKSSIASLEASIEVNPVDPEAYLLLGQILLKVGEYDRAVEFLDRTAKTFPDNGTVFYMFSVANKMAGHKLPAVLAARRSAEIFQKVQDKDNMLKAAVLLQDLIETPDDAFKNESKSDAQEQTNNNRK